MGAVPSIPTDPSRTVQVIGAGYSRTGTVSMQMALEVLLDGPVIHGGTHIFCSSDSYNKNWIEAYRAKFELNDKQATLKHVRNATRGFVGTTDLPTIDFIEEMIELYPEAKVVLVNRDPERWWKSVEQLIGNITPWWLPVAMSPVPGWRWFPKYITWFGKSQKRFLPADHKGGKETLALYNNDVRRIVPKDRLLEMELGQGWGPLCKFLGKPIPDQPFPRANDSKAVDEYAQKIFFKLAQVWLGIFSATGAAAYGAYWLWANEA